ncbi:adenosylmethionine--8-amino-7-oxononanoate transaminase [Colwellia sp. MB02u-18]|uniref:adenosylmethionine--8-amino-7-oxononanoate transaminase n=1 Tax=unclassified Colwellia TaxID=196834 RepID=UPI0015F50C62|nr:MULTISPECIES: adenosylmethionine--8-amino-7-oxononanoate transaminase [unclassified Colwellia]MBA6224749.1 adenosylmethionine--8-amino-7-oxononanoate transaminase [Colwellia sp. MB3u-45]MBA6266799.1 adenosylmethionine--8-amino-7-oxononanoate transaminase [Colwellia sp. MB3u-43]MBA6321394.1 adenosylmethionine--8-amino-7-oxononanoate transaminase [Colwellia sp. MB02u-19]MBA6323601.1 adenosylmethionine--8-amino-7-oxononanoate transaminase [Colwellia sp. MB02u-18]MBA6332422.1 adenosylmethionine
MNTKKTENLEFDKNHVWHPYTSMSKPLPSYLVESAEGVHITLASGEKLVDGMSSWWSVLHGYNHPELNEALIKQTEKFAHVMFGGLTHEPAIELAKTLIELTPEGLNKVFLSDSGSVSVEVALKMSIQYWHSKNKPEKHKILTVRNGYHGDTFAAMSVCDPVNGMHQLFEPVLMKNLFAPAPTTRFDQAWDATDVEALTAMFAQHHEQIAAFIIEPIVQGAGGMRLYHPNYLKACRKLCNQYNVLMIADEIATGLGRTGKLFACEWADISPDIICLGKTLTGGYMTLAATLCTDEVANTISHGEAGCFMHGPTFMGNPLACALANANLKILKRNQWQQQVTDIEQVFKQQLLPLKNHHRVQDIRVLGAIGVVQSTEHVDMAEIQKRFVELGVWIRPFGQLIYIMPPFISDKTQLSLLINAISIVLDEDKCFKRN